MKKIIVFAFVLSVVALFASCNNDNKTGNDNRGASSTDSAGVAPSDSTGRQY